ncbi:MAG: hypothetical protein ABWK53_05640 [Anaerolineales bacterium]
MPAPEKKIRYFVKREKTIQAFDEFLRGDEHIWVADLSADHGIGKTTVLLHYYRSRGNIKHAWVDLRARKFKTPLFQEAESPAALTAMAEAQEGYRALLLDIGADLWGVGTPEYQDFLAEIRTIMPDHLLSADKFVSQIGRFVRKVNLKPELNVAGMRLGLGGVELEAPFERRRSFQELSQIRRQMTEALARRLVGLSLQGIILIVLDDFCQIRGSWLERWIVGELLPHLQMCKVVLSHTEVDGAFLPPQVYPVPLERFSLAETRKYVEGRLGPEALALGLDARLHARFDGNPQRIEWAVDSIQTMGLARAAVMDFLRQTAAGSAQSQIETLAKIQMDLLLQRHPEAGAVVDVACVLQEFDRNLLQEVAREVQAALDVPDWGMIWSELNHLSFVETAEGGRRLVVHPDVARWRESWLRTQNEAYVEQIHRAAAGWYGSVMQKQEEDSDESVWERLHRYELGKWQSLSQGWLRHLAACSDAGLEIARRYFDAFFWWGEYIDFPFCERLLEDLKGCSLSPRSWKVVEILDEFHHAFVPQRRQQGKAEWAEKTLALLRHLSERAGLLNPPEDDALRWHLRGLVENYVAEARLAADPHDALVETAYRSSAAAFFKARDIYAEMARQASQTGDRKASRRYRDEADSEAWYGGWMCTWLAGFYAGRGEAEKALKAADLAERTILKADPKDIEALGRIHAARGDVHFSAGRWEQALQEYQCYALFALGFLIDEYGVGGDTYTLEYLRECLEHVYGRLLELQNRAPDALTAWWSAWLAFWGEERLALLPSSVGRTFPGTLEGLWQTDALGHVVEHALPLPRLPEYQIGEDLSLNLTPEFQERVESAFYQLRERCVQQGLLPQQI